MRPLPYIVQAPQGAQTLYQYDLQGHLLVELTGTGTPIRTYVPHLCSAPMFRTYVWRDDTPVAQIDNQPSRKILYFEPDYLNTPRADMDETGKVVWRWESDAFGSTVANEDPDGDGVKVTVNLRFPDKYYDRETGCITTTLGITIRGLGGRWKVIRNVNTIKTTQNIVLGITGLAAGVVGAFSLDKYDLFSLLVISAPLSVLYFLEILGGFWSYVVVITYYLVITNTSNFFKSLFYLPGTLENGIAWPWL